MNASRVAAMNLAVCSAFGDSFAVDRSHNLHLLVKQFEQRSRLSRELQFAHLAYMLSTLRPFSRNNVRTAIILLAEEFRLSREEVLLLGGMLKHGTDVDSLTFILQE